MMDSIEMDRIVDGIKNVFSDPVIMYEIAMLYYNGEKVPQNYEEAHRFLSIAISLDSDDARGMKGLMMKKGLGCPKFS